MMSNSEVPGGNAFVVGDPTHAIVKQGYRDPVAIDLSERLESLKRSRDGAAGKLVRLTAPLRTPIHAPTGHAVVAVRGPAPWKPRFPASSPYVADATLASWLGDSLLDAFRAARQMIHQPMSDSVPHRELWAVSAYKHSDGGRIRPPTAQSVASMFAGDKLR